MCFSRYILFGECFLKTLLDADATDFTAFHGKNRNKKAPFRGFREIRVRDCVKVVIKTFTL
jgi:hypothetical protein